MKITAFKKIISLALSLALLLSATSLIAAASQDPKNEFISSVGLIETADGLNDKEAYLYDAKDALDGYITAGGSVTDAEIAESYQKYLQYKEAIEADIERHYAFMDAVNNAKEHEDGSYVTFKGYLLEAEALLDTLDLNYYGMSTSLSLYNNMVFTLAEEEEVCELFLEYVKKAQDATTYAEVARYTTEAQRLLTNVTIEDYPGIEEGEDILNERRTYMGDCELKAAPFLAAVNDLNKATNLPLAIKEAYALLETIDETTLGVDIAVSSLKNEQRKYDRSVETANEEFEELNTLIFSFIF